MNNKEKARKYFNDNHQLKNDKEVYYHISEPVLTEVINIAAGPDYQLKSLKDKLAGYTLRLTEIEGNSKESVSLRAGIELLIKVIETMTK